MTTSTPTDRAVSIATAALAATDGDPVAALTLLAMRLDALTQRYRLATSPGFERRGLPRGRAGTAAEPEAL